MLKQGGPTPDPSEELAPALDSEPVFERPEVGRWDQAPRSETNIWKSEKHVPSGAWTDSRASFGLESSGGMGFVDPGSYALASHSTPMMQADFTPSAAMESASMDLGTSSDFGGGGGGGGSGGGGGDGGGGGGDSGSGSGFA